MSRTVDQPSRAICPVLIFETEPDLGCSPSGCTVEGTRFARSRRPRTSTPRPLSPNPEERVSVAPRTLTRQFQGREICRSQQVAQEYGDGSRRLRVLTWYTTNSRWYFRLLNLGGTCYMNAIIQSLCRLNNFYTGMEEAFGRHVGYGNRSEVSIFQSASRRFMAPGSFQSCTFVTANIPRDLRHVFTGP